MFKKRFLAIAAIGACCSTLTAGEVIDSFHASPSSKSKLRNAVAISETSPTKSSSDSFKAGDLSETVQTVGYFHDVVSKRRDKPCNNLGLLSCDQTNCDENGCDGVGSSCGSRVSNSWRTVLQGDGLVGLGILPRAISYVKPSEGCFDDFISPMTNPVYFEDPRQLTEARFIFIDHKLPVILGNPAGRIQLYALQARVRLTENLSFIAVKDGFVVSQSPLLDDGWGDLSAGLKYTLYRDTQAGRILSAGARFEMPTGMGRSLQGNGDGVLDIFTTGGFRLDDRSHLITASGFILPMDSQAENQLWYWSNHLDRRLGDSRLYAFSELNWYHYLKDASAFPVPLEGGDLFNLGSPGIGGNDIVTNAYGVKYKPNRHIESGIAWEFPLTERRGVLDNRLTVDLILRY